MQRRPYLSHSVVRAVFAVLLALVVSVAGAGAASAATWTVCATSCNFTTIQAAVAAGTTVNGDTIDVKAGLYSGAIELSKSLILRGAQAGNSPVAGRSGSETTLTGSFTIRASNVTIDGFSLTNPIGTYAIMVKTAGSYAVIKNNVIDGVGSSVSTSNVHTIYLERGPDDVRILDNVIRNLFSGTKTASAVGVIDTASSDPSKNLVVSGNVISNVKSESWGAYGVIVNNKAGAPDARIQDNTIEQLEGLWGHAIGLEGPTPNVVVTGNHISDVKDAKPIPDAVAILFQANPSYSTAVVSFNSFDEVEAGIALHPDYYASGAPAGFVLARCNWWGSADGPGPVGAGTGVMVGLNVTFEPWLTGFDHGSACNGGTPRGIKQLVVADLDIYLQTSSIDKKTSKSIREAIRHIQKSLDSDLWVDDSLLAGKGQKVFEEEKHAVQKLADIKNPSSEIVDAIDALVFADSLLAESAVAEAERMNADVGKAYDELTKAAGYGSDEKAIEHYKKAWQHAMKGMKKVDQSDFFAFNIRNNSGLIAPPWDSDLKIAENAAGDGFSAATPRSGQKVGYGSTAFDNLPLNSIESVDWDKVSGKAGLVAYLNIWVTDGTNFAVISSENDYRGTDFAARTEWKAFEYEYSPAGLPAKNPVNLDWLCKTGTATLSSQYLKCDGQLATLADISENVKILSPTGTYPWYVGTGAPRGGFGFNLIFGDTQANFVGSYELEHVTVTANGTVYYARDGAKK